MRTTLLATVLTFGFLGAAASAQDVAYDYDKQADFSTLKTYAWAVGTRVSDDLNHKRIMDAIDAELASKGLVRVDASANPTVLVAYHASFDKQARLHAFGYGGGYRFGPARSGIATVDEVSIGTIVVDLINPKTGTTVWRGMVSKEVDLRAAPEKRERNIKKAAAKLFKNYPPNS